MFNHMTDLDKKRMMTEDEMVESHHRLNGLEFKQVPGVGDGQGGLACCSPWGCKEMDTTERLKWTDLTWKCHCLREADSCHLSSRNGHLLGCLSLWALVHLQPWDLLLFASQICGSRHSWLHMSALTMLPGGTSHLPMIWKLCRCFSGGLADSTRVMKAIWRLTQKTPGMFVVMFAVTLTIDQS